MFGIKVFRYAIRMGPGNWWGSMRIGRMPMAICVTLGILFLTALRVPLDVGLVGLISVITLTMVYGTYLQSQALD
jgi:hypothetical protein